MFYLFILFQRYAGALKEVLTEAEWVPDEQAETRVLTAECAAWLEEGGTTLADVPDNYLNCAQRLNSVHLTAAYRLFP